MFSEDFLEERHARFVIPEEAAKKTEVQGQFKNNLHQRRASSQNSLMNEEIDQVSPQISLTLAKQQSDTATEAKHLIQVESVQIE